MCGSGDLESCINSEWQQITAAIDNELGSSRNVSVSVYTYTMLLDVHNESELIRRSRNLTHPVQKDQRLD